MTFRCDPTGFVAIIATFVCCGCSPERVVVAKAKPVSLVAVKTVSVMQKDVARSTTQPASVHAFHRSEIRARTTGYVQQLNVDIGDVVKAGDVLAIIDVPEPAMQQQVMRAQVQRLQAQERRFESGVELAQANVRAAEAMVQQAASERAGIDAAYAAADAEFQRTQSLVQRGSLQNRMLDESRFKRDSEQARQESADAAVASAQADLSVTQAKVAAAKSELEAAKAETKVAQKQLAALEVELAFANVIAPFDGIITARHVEPGDLVNGDSSARTDSTLFVVSQTDRLRVRMAVPESDAPWVNRGDEVALTLPSFGDEPVIMGTVTRRSGELDPHTRTMTVEAVIDNTDGKLLPGMFGQATINLETQLAASVLPSRAVRFSDDGQAYVYAVDDDDTVSVVPLTAGMDTGLFIEVEGIAPGQRVIASHLNRFVDGQKVSVLP